jgi:hypothetical protein
VFVCSDPWPPLTNEYLWGRRLWQMLATRTVFSVEDALLALEKHSNSEALRQDPQSKIDLAAGKS